MSTLLQLINMQDGELIWVANHMGHTEDTHFAWCQKELSTIELTKLARTLTAADEGKNIKKKKIDDLMNSGGTVRDAVETDDAEKGIFSCIFVFDKFHLPG